MSPLKCSTCVLLALLVGFVLSSCAPMIRYGKGDPTYFGPKHSGVWLWGDDGSGRDPCPAPHVWMDWGQWDELANWRGPSVYLLDGQRMSACITEDVFLRGVCSGKKPIQGRAWEPVIMPRSQLEQLGVVIQTEDVVIMNGGGSPEAKAAAAMSVIDMLMNPDRPVEISIMNLQSVVCPQL